VFLLIQFVLDTINSQIMVANVHPCVRL